MKSRTKSPKSSAPLQLECARRVVSILFEKTGLATILREAPTVTLGAGNWISFAAQQPLSREVVLSLTASNGKPAFVPDLFNGRARARSKTSPSLHLANLGSNEILQGHVDAHYWAKHPIAHAAEFLRKKTTLPSELLARLQSSKRCL